MLILPIQLAAFSLDISALFSFLIFIRFARSKSKCTKRNDISAVQESHITPTPRIGGLAIVIALTAVGFISMISNNWNNYSLLILSALSVFSVGRDEDVSFLASPRRRLFATGISGAVVIALLGQWLLKTFKVSQHFSGMVLKTRQLTEILNLATQKLREWFKDLRQPDEYNGVTMMVMHLNSRQLLDISLKLKSHAHDGPKI
jgi:UDP-N-acetylmuramyl pentapeptide phosphotransferase/UDP-N-acetylglucosamine-1-phosphate transferase